MATNQFTLNLNSQVAGVREDLKSFQKRQLPNLVRAALRDTARELKVEASRQMSGKVIAMTKTKIKKQIRVVPPKPDGFKAALIFRRKKTSSIASFKTDKQRKSVKGKRRFAGEGLRARVWEDKQLYKGSFLWARRGVDGVAVTAFHRVSGAPKVTPKRRVGGLGKKRTYKRDYTDKKRVLHKKGSPIKRQPIQVTFGTSVAAAFDQVPKKGNRKPVRVTLATAGRRIFKEKLQQRISKLK